MFLNGDSKDRPLVSVLIPAYCHEKYITSCIDGVISQTYDNIEVLICDDNSSDNTYSLICDRRKDLEERFNRVCVMKNNVNKGVCKSLNRMIKESKGIYIKGIASDDILLPNAIEDLVNAIEVDSEYGAVVGNGVMIGSAEMYPIIKLNGYREVYNNSLSEEELSFVGLYQRNRVFAPAVLFRRNVFDCIGFYDEDCYFEDYEYWLRMTSNAVKIGFCDNKVVAYRVHGKSMSHYGKDSESIARLKRMFEARIELLDKYEQVAGKFMNPKEGYKLMCSSTLEEAIDSQANDIIGMIMDFAENRKIRIKFATVVKMLCYKMHVLLLIQRIKRKLGLATAECYD